MRQLPCVPAQGGLGVQVGEECSDITVGLIDLDSGDQCAYQTNSVVRREGLPDLVEVRKAASDPRRL